MSNRISKKQCIYAMDGNNSIVFRAKSGDSITFETCDCFQDQITREDINIDSIDWDHINPATGPVYIEGAEPGDILKIEIMGIKVNDYGVMAAIPGAGLLGENVDRSQVKIVPIQDGRAVFSNNITLPVEPMIGVIGVAPSKEAVPCGTPGSHGGNMDNARIGAGATLYLPVFAEGALLAMGDLHACMGDGEIMVTGVEAAGSVDVKVEVIKGMKIDNPILEDKNCIYTIASDTDLMKAIKTATAEMHNIVMRKLGLSYNEAGMLMSAAGNVQICQVVDPSLTVRFAMPKTIIANIF